MVIKTGAGQRRPGAARRRRHCSEIGGENYDANARDSGIAHRIHRACSRRPTAIPLEIVAATNKVIEDLNRRHRPACKSGDVFNIVHFVKASISEVQHALVEAILIVVVVILLFLGSFRSVLIPLSPCRCRWSALPR